MPAASPLPRRSRRKLLAWSFLALFLLPVLGAAGTLAYHGGPTHWSRWDRSVTSRLADAATNPEARVLVMAGRTRGWKGAVALHSWIAIKRENGEMAPLRRRRLGQSGPAQLVAPGPLVRRTWRGDRRPQGR